MATSAKRRGSWPRATDMTPQRVGHVGVGDAEHGRGRRLDARARAAPPTARWIAARPGRAVERHAAGQARVVGSVPEHDVRVGHGRVLAALPVGGRARLRARARRPDAQRLRRRRRGRSSRRRRRCRATSICGTLIGIPAASPEKRTCGSPPTTSRCPRSCRPCRRSARRARRPRRPAARRRSRRPPGPDAASATGSSRARSAGATPPLDCMRCSGTAHALARRPRRRRRRRTRRAAAAARR